jgi:hypothetical protein
MSKRGRFYLVNHRQWVECTPSWVFFWPCSWVTLNLDNRLTFVNSLPVEQESWQLEERKSYHTSRLIDTRWRQHWEDIAYASPDT